jgi:hypothetical protein
MLGMECYAFGFPLVLMDASNRTITATPNAGEYSAPYNQLLRMPGFVPVPNALNRYGVTSGMPLKYNADGSLDIYIQARSPAADKESSWLPCPPSDPFNLTIRVYQPEKSLLNGSYKIRPVTRVRSD